jgi:katanin p60 ATPase-containing subunit A1
LDDILLRSFRKFVYVPLPDRDARRAFLAGSIGEMADASLNVGLWADRLEGYTCGDIEQLCRDAVHIAFDEQTKIDVTDAWMRLSLADGNIVITSEVFEQAFNRCNALVSGDSAARYEEWRQQKASG